MEITLEFKEKVVAEMLAKRENYGRSDKDYATSLNIPASTYSMLKKGHTHQLLSTPQWITLARHLGVETRKSTWKTVRTQLYIEIEANLKFCKENGKSMMFVDECGIGKSHCAKHIIRQMRNAFYFDCSQYPSKTQFIRALAQTIGLERSGSIADIKANIKYFLNMMEEPLVVLDEAGDLEYPAFLIVKELWNGTDCGWYMMGADGLRAKIENGIQNRKVGYAEIFSRFSDEYIKLVPIEKEQRQAFLRDMIRQVAEANTTTPEKVPQIVRACLSKNRTLRFLETLIKTNAA